ncbi:MAG: hypothetical protein HW380_2973 [Magnetococcales bacterium]|nr:hypothetical protein [Magnetococcales bacterium]
MKHNLDSMDTILNSVLHRFPGPRFDRFPPHKATKFTIERVQYQRLILIFDIAKEKRVRFCRTHQGASPELLENSGRERRERQLPTPVGQTPDRIHFQTVAANH